MRALCWHGHGDVRVDNVPDPTIEHPRDAIIKISACAICGSDLHLRDGYQPTMKIGDILGHENMGTVIELGSEVSNLKSAIERSYLSRSAAGSAGFARRGSFQPANAPIRTPRWRPRPWDILRQDYSASATCSVATAVAKPNTYACQWPI